MEPVGPWKSLPESITDLLTTVPIIVVYSDNDFIDLQNAKPLLGKVPHWHRDHMGLWATYKPKGATRIHVTQFMLSDYSGNGYHDKPEGGFPDNGDFVLSVEYPTQCAVMVIWLNCALANNRFLFHRTGTIPGLQKETEDCVYIMPNLHQPSWIMHGYQQDVGWVK